MLATSTPKTMQATTPSRGAVVRTYRALRGWTIDELAEAMGLTPSYISMIENERREPRDMGLWQRFSKVLNIPWDRIMGHGGSGTPPSTPPPGGLDLADEEALLAACWSLFYRSGFTAAVPVTYGAIRRLTAAGSTGADGLMLRLLGRYHQLAAVLARDSDDLAAAVSHGTMALDIARQQNEPEALGAALFRLARIYHAQQNDDIALQLSREAVSLAHRTRPPLRGYLYQHLADLTSATKAEPRYVVEGYLDKARAALRGNQEDDGSFTILSEAGIAHDEALLRLRFGSSLAECRMAIDRAARTLPADAVRWRAGLTCTEVLAYAKFGEIDSAVALAEEVMTAAAPSSSQRKRLRTAYVLLKGQAANHPAVARLGHRIEALPT